MNALGAIAIVVGDENQSHEEHDYTRTAILTRAADRSDRVHPAYRVTLRSEGWSSARLQVHTRDGEVTLRRPAGRPPALLRLRPLLPAARRRDRRLQGPLQRRRTAARAVGLRRRRAVRSDREEAVLPRLSRRARLQLRHARLRSSLRLLPELGDLAGAARSGRRRAADRRRRRTRSCATRSATARRRHRQHLQRAAHHQRVGGRGVQGGEGARGSSRGSSRTATARRRCSNTSRPWVDLYKVDLKSFDDRHYRELGGTLQPILDTIRRLHAMGIWLEIVTLLIPGFNDSRRRARRGSPSSSPSVVADIPWHVTAFHGDYKMTEPGEHDRRACCCGGRDRPGAGLRYVYAGNLPGAVGDLRGHALPGVRRASSSRARVITCSDYRITPDGRVPSCAHAGAGPMERRLRRADRLAGPSCLALGRLISP